jgi:AcrR family transcriptional regulator
MSPRPYSMAKRQVARNETRLRILEATRQLLANESQTDLSMEAVARSADVSRLTIYYQFSSRAGLLEGLFDHLAGRGNMHRMAEVFQESDPAAALEKMVRTFVGFWASDPVALRRLRAMSSLDPEIARGIQSRDARRPHIAREILKRAAAASTKRSSAHLRVAADVLGMLTSFESYDALARAGRTEEEIVSTLTRLVHCATGHLPAAKVRRSTSQ